MSVPAVARLLSSLLSRGCITLWLSHQIWGVGLAKLLSADSTLFASKSTESLRALKFGSQTVWFDFLGEWEGGWWPYFWPLWEHLWLKVWVTQWFVHFFNGMPAPFFVFFLSSTPLNIDSCACSIMVTDQRQFDTIQRDGTNLFYGLHHQRSFSSPLSGARWQAVAKYSAAAGSDWEGVKVKLWLQNKVNGTSWFEAKKVWQINKQNRTQILCRASGNTHFQISSKLTRTLSFQSDASFLFRDSLYFLRQGFFWALSCRYHIRSAVGLLLG